MMMRSHEYTAAFHQVRENSKSEKPLPYGPAVDEAALLVAKWVRSKLSQAIHLALTYEQWTQLTAIIQSEVAVAIRHSAYDKPEYPITQAPQYYPYRLEDLPR